MFRMLSLVVALSALITVSHATSLQNVTILCKDLKSILVTPEQLNGKWMGFEIYRGMESIADAITEMCSILEVKKLTSSIIEIITKVYYQDQLVSNNVTELVAEGDRWIDKQQNFNALIVSVNPEQYITEVICDNPPDASKSKVLYLLTNRRPGVTLNANTVAKLRGDLQSALKLQDLQLIMPYGTSCK